MREGEHERRPRPAVSVVMATYNRPKVLGFAIRSVIAQDLDDWELLVVGDACADATAAVVASFDDPRIRYINLPINYGEQSGPNNVGIRRARGRYIAFLNQDDFWFPDHLRAAVGWLEASGADAVIALTADVGPSEAPAERRWTVSFQGRGRDGRYDPVTSHGPASAMLLKAAVARAAPPWPPAAECFSMSSQEWLFRLWRKGFAIRTVPHLSVIRILSGIRRGSYVSSDTAEHAYFELQLQAPNALRQLLLDRCHPPASPRRSVIRRMGRPLLRAALRCAAHAGFMPDGLLTRFVAGYRRGQSIDELRKIRGLPPLPARAPTIPELRARYIEAAPCYGLGGPIDFSVAGEGQRVRLDGWHLASREGTWSSGSLARLRIRLAQPPRGDLRLCAEIRAAPQVRQVDVLVDGNAVDAWPLGDSAFAVRSAVITTAMHGGRTSLDIGFRVQDAGEERTTHAICVRSVRVDADTKA